MIAGQMMLVRWPDALLLLPASSIPRKMRRPGFMSHLEFELERLKDHVYMECNRIGRWHLRPVCWIGPEGYPYK